MQNLDRAGVNLEEEGLLLDVQLLRRCRSQK